MLKKIFIYTVLLWIVYNIALSILTIEKLNPQSNYDFNVIKAQKYLYEPELFSNVIVGSSLGNRIDSKLFSEDYCFLTFSGLGSADGLEIIKHAAVPPDIVFIEINVLERAMNKDFTEEALNWSFNNFNDYLPSTHKAHKPTSIIEKPLAYLVYGVYNQFKEHDTIAEYRVPEQPITTTKSNTSVDSISKRPSMAATTHFKFMAQKYMQVVPEHRLLELMTELKHYVEILNQNKVKVVFYEMPVSESLKNLEKPRQIRHAFYKTFPKENYEYIMAPADFKVISNDGIHLTAKSILEYSEFFREQTELISKQEPDPHQLVFQKLRKNIIIRSKSL